MLNTAAQYASTVFPDGYTVLGVRLRPMTIGHALLLTRIGSPLAPFAAPAGRDPTLQDLVIALWVCSRPCSAAASGLQRSRTGWWMRLREWSVRWAYWRRIDRALHGWVAYMRACCSGPMLWVKQDSAPSKVPILQTLLLHRQHRMGESRAAAMETPVAVALWDLAAYAVGTGAVDLVDDDEQELMRKDTERRAALAE